MRTAIAAITLVLMLTACTSPSDRLAQRELDAQDSATAHTSTMIHLYANMSECEEHLKIDITHQNAQWRKFAKTHHIESYPEGMTDATLQDCLNLNVKGGK